MSGHVRFTEEMGGFAAPGAPDATQGWHQGKVLGWSFMFHLTIWIDDLDAFLADPDKTAVAVGWVDCPALGGRLNVERGVFNLFVPTADPKLSNMRYRLWFEDDHGRPITLEGHKDIGDNPGFDVWKDTTCLFTTLRLGHVEASDEAAADARAAKNGDAAVEPDEPVERDEPDERDERAEPKDGVETAVRSTGGPAGPPAVGGEPAQAGQVIARGLLYIRPVDFATQLTTFRGDFKSTLRFGRLFMATLWRTYRGGLPG